MLGSDPHTNRRSYLKAAGAIGIAGLAGCLGDDLPTVNTAYVVAGGNKPSLFEIDDLVDEVADNAGEEYELSVEAIGDTPDHVTAVAADEIQVGMSTVGSLPSAIIEDRVEGGVTAVASDYVDAHPDHFAIGTYAAEDSDIESAADLEGGTVGVNGIGTGVHAIVVRELQNHDLTEDDVEFIEVPFPGMRSSIDEGEIDAGIVPNTFAAEMELAGGYEQIFDSHDAFGTSYPFTYLFVGNEYLDENEDLVEAYLEDYASLVDHILDEDNRDDVVEMLVDEFGTDFDTYDHVFYTENDYFHPNPPELDVEGLQTAVDDLADMGFIDEQVDMEPHVDNSYLP